MAVPEEVTRTGMGGGLFEEVFVYHVLVFESFHLSLASAPYTAPSLNRRRSTHRFARVSVNTSPSFSPLSYIVH
ncbi:unnamed protein product [Lactuca virosa]|uniref:Uncharacterized protein n=1 Tax=Lactuca virosa TaxID=75947 RepID=A0AAU9LXW7_9ASTR|nr:unnamed protein product [Lactuca virosa]